MSKRDFILFFILGLMIGMNLFFFNPFAHAQQNSINSNNGVPSQAVNSSNVSPSTSNQPQLTNIPTSVTSPFNFTSLPTNTGGPQNDIYESNQLTVNRSTVQVDDWVKVSVGIKNVATYNKTIQALCFESTAGNFGCDWGINLTPGQTYYANNIGSWTTTGTQNIWVTWTQDGVNWYQPLNAHIVSINVI